MMGLCRGCTVGELDCDSRSAYVKISDSACGRGGREGGEHAAWGQLFISSKAFLSSAVTLASSCLWKIKRKT